MSIAKILKVLLEDKLLISLIIIAPYHHITALTHSETAYQIRAGGRGKDQCFSSILTSRYSDMRCAMRDSIYISHALQESKHFFITQNGSHGKICINESYTVLIFDFKIDDDRSNELCTIIHAKNSNPNWLKNAYPFTAIKQLVKSVKNSEIHRQYNPRKMLTIHYEKRTKAGERFHTMHLIN